MSERNGDSDARYYAEVALPVHVYRTFTYTLPKVFQNIAEAGARVVVPVGRRLNTGYIVKLTERLPPGLDQGAIKEVRDLIDLVPVVSDEILTITKWVADYYAAPWGEVLRAALPPGITETIEQIITVTPKGLDSDQTRTLTGNKRVLRELAIAEGDVNLRSASSAVRKPEATVAARALRRQGLPAIRQKQRGDRARTEHRSAVR